MTKEQFESFNTDPVEIIKLIAAILKSTKNIINHYMHFTKEKLEKAFTDLLGQEGCSMILHNLMTLGSPPNEITD